MAAESRALGFYQGRAIVTGTGEVSRQAGFAAALQDVVVKVSGDPSLASDPRAAALAKAPGALVASFAYRDRMEGIPFHDEQGSRDRPHDLTVTFDRAKVDAALQALGRQPWAEPRPTVLLLVAVDNTARSFLLTSDGRFGADMRVALDAASWKIGLPVRLPPVASIAAAGLSTAAAIDTDFVDLAQLARTVGGDAVIAGQLTWDASALGWVGTWRLDSGRRRFRWSVRGVSFDAAFRNALNGAAQVLSGNGVPSDGGP